jgi:hypothetical protein
MSNEAVQLKCPRCGHVWQMAAAVIRRRYEQIIYRDTPPPDPAIEDYRVQCPVCHTHFIVGLQTQN